MEKSAEITFIGRVVSPLKSLAECPRQGSEGAPAARIEIFPPYQRAMEEVKPGDRLVVITWFHQADRSVLCVHPRHDTSRPLTGVFSTRSPARPNPLGLHEVVVKAVEEGVIHVEPLEALNGTPVVDIKIGMHNGG